MAAKDILAEALQLVVPDAAAEGAELLKSIKDEDLRKSVFICLVYRMDAEDLKAMVDKGASAEDVALERNEFLVSLASDQDPVINKAEKALEKAERMEKEQEGIKDFLKNELTQMLEMSKASGERERDALREQISMLTAQMKSEQMQKAELKDRAEEMDKQLKENLSRVAEYEALIKELQKRNSQLERDVSAGNREAFMQTRNAGNAYEGAFKRKRFRRSETVLLQEMDDFCTELMKKPDLNDEQKDYLLSCLEEGYPMNLVSKVMVSTLSVDQMQRFIKIYEKRMGGKTR